MMELKNVTIVDCLFTAVKSNEVKKTNVNYAHLQQPTASISILV